MFNKYLIGAVGIVLLILSGTAYYFYKDSQSKLIEITALKEEQSRLNTVIDNRDQEIKLQKGLIVIQENILKENREKVEKTQEDHQKIEEEVSKEPGYTDDAAPVLKKLFESLKARQ